MVSKREEISHGRAADLPSRAIALNLARTTPTISREEARNSRRKAYWAAGVVQRAWDRAKRPKAGKLPSNEPLCRVIARKLDLKWSPQQIAGSLRGQYSDEEARRVLHKTIYRSLHVQTCCVMKEEFLNCLRS